MKLVRHVAENFRGDAIRPRGLVGGEAVEAFVKYSFSDGGEDGCSVSLGKDGEMVGGVCLLPRVGRIRGGDCGR